MIQKYSWLPFFKLAWGEQFFLGAAKAEKETGFTAWRGGMRVFMNPLKRVRSMRPYGKVTPCPYPTEIQTLKGTGPKISVLPAIRTEPVEGE